MKKRPIGLLIVWALVSGSLAAQTPLEIPRPEGSRSDQPEIVFAANGTLWAAWPSFRNGRFKLAAAARRDGAWTPIDYPDPSGEDQIQPVLVRRASHGISLVYTALSTSQSEVRLVDHDGIGWSEPRTLGMGTHPALTHDGRRLWAAWVHDGDLHYGPLESSAPENDPPPLKLLRGQPSLTPVLAAGPGGAVWLAFSQPRPGYQSVRLMRIDRDDRPSLTVDDHQGINRNPRISIDAGGRVWIVYEKLIPFGSTNGSSWEHSGRPVYLMDRGYRVEYPSQTIRVTDGENWWVPSEPERPAAGLMPSIFCSSGGPVHLISRAFPGYQRPFRYFSPLLETLSAGGWENREETWPYGACYKAPTALAEDPSGRIWAAWAIHDREKKGSLETPSWTHLDGPDRIVAAPLPSEKTEGPPALTTLAKAVSAAPPPGQRPRFNTRVGDEALNVYFGDIHQHSEFSGCGRWNGRIDQNQSYTRYVRDLDFMCTIDHAEHLNPHGWHATRTAARLSSRPGEFIAFTGFEWTSEFDAGGNLYRGHYNAVFRNIGEGDAYFSASDPQYNTPLELWEALREAVGGPENVLTLAHHTSRRMAWLTWNYYDPDMAPLIEIAQARGSFEYEGCPSGPNLDNDCARVSGHFIRDGLERGMRWGFSAAGDHGGRQLTAVFAPELTRDEIFRAFRSKRAYATTGERIFLDTRVDGRFMGEEYQLESDARRITIEAEGTAPIVEIDLIRNGRGLRKWTPGRRKVRLEWVDREPLSARENYYYVRVIQAGGNMAWSSPTWAIDPAHPGRFRFQVGGDELHVVYPDREEDFSVLMHNETERTVEGTVTLSLPRGWSIREKTGLDVVCPPGAWRHAVFHVTAPAAAVERSSLPSVTADFHSADDGVMTSPLFVVASPDFLTRERKAALIDARARIRPDDFPEYFERLIMSWKKESK